MRQLTTERRAGAETLVDDENQENSVTAKAPRHNDVMSRDAHPGERGRVLAEDVGGPSHQHTLTLTPVPSAARLARAWVVSVLEGWPEEGIENAYLVVSELVTNAILHARTPIVLDCEASGPQARFEVRDEQHGAPLVKPYALDSPTGRGMRLVNSVAEEWGVSTSTAGKAVWCVVSAHPNLAPPARSSRLSADPAPMTAPGDGPEPGAGSRVASGAGPAPTGTVTVRILGLPLDVYYEAEEHNDAVIRELTLIVQSSEASDAHDVPRRLLALANDVHKAFARATPGLRAQVERARERGHERVDLELRVPTEGWQKLSTLATQLDELDRFCENGDMLTIASPPRLRRFRRWYANEVSRQVRGEPPSAWPEGDEA